MTDYKEMYLKLFQALDQVISILTAVQQECEELYISDNDQTEPKVIPILFGDKQSTDKK